MSRRQLIAGNWKMNGTRESLREISAVAAALQPDAVFDALICPPATLLAAAVEAARGSALGIGAQDCHAEPGGAFTGDISAPMIKDCGATAVILGHSERRAHHGETSAEVARKAEAAHGAGLIAIVCIGETEGERRFGLAEAVCRRHVRGSLPPSATPANTVIAYEPVWAIGTGLTPGTADIAAIHGAIRAALPSGESWRILYGGSVKPDSAGAILALADVDGVLVGGASLKAADFLAIAGASRRAVS